MLVLHFVSIQKKSILNRLLQKVFHQKCIIIFDLEDTLFDLDKNKAKKIKAWGRSELLEFASSYPRFSEKRLIGIRVNGLQTAEFEEDLEMITKISKFWNLHCIVGPKVESRENIDRYQFNFQKKGIAYKTFIPIIETAHGLTLLSSITSHQNINYAIYGHYDYSLDAGHWPFLEQEEHQFWEIVSQFILEVEHANVQYIHPPIPYSDNVRLFTQVWLRLHAQCKRPFGIMTINDAQTAFYNHLFSSFSVKAIELQSINYSQQEKIDQANYTIKVCSAKKRQFGFDPKTGKFFSPHQYEAALRFLKQQTLVNK